MSGTRNKGILLFFSCLFRPRTRRSERAEGEKDKDGEGRNTDRDGGHRHSKQHRLLRELPRHAADIVTVAYYTGMRAGEIYGMTWERVNMKQGYFNLTQKETKTGEARHVYFSGAVRKILERLEKIRYISHNFVFTYRAGESPSRASRCALRGR